ncbi:hypothetical protein [Streptomyces aurantiogriseus]|uniref:Uncharacterized protein n=1 Tax=Streptomyces aurantiogriseus TaxID=66870 RepID=A0A918FK16_9ACTN|nr:hypothetical protein [Streptomyces aurantiogriseus]GGR45207.1 hypothetical protein GCM10010251_72800 [Streptomyces aurantiogriseus]
MSVLSVRRGATGVGAVVVLVATGSWAMGATNAADVDPRLWGEVRPVIEDRLAADSRGSGYGETELDLGARWFCRAEALELQERGEAVRAGVNTLCMEYGVRDDSLVECSGARYPQVVRLERDEAAAGGYRVVSREEPPDGAGYTQWIEANFSVFGEFAAEDPMSSDALESAARVHFGLPEDAPVQEC